MTRPPDLLGGDSRSARRYYLSALDFRLGERQVAGIAEFARRVCGTEAGFPPDVKINLLGSR